MVKKIVPPVVMASLLFLCLGRLRLFGPPRRRLDRSQIRRKLSGFTLGPIYLVMGMFYDGRQGGANRESVPVIVEVITERATNIAMGTEADSVNEFEDILCLDSSPALETGWVSMGNGNDDA